MQNLLKLYNLEYDVYLTCDDYCLIDISYEQFMREEYYPTGRYRKITPWIFIDNKGKLFFWAEDKIAILQLFLKKYRKLSLKRYKRHPDQLPKILDNFPKLNQKEKEIKLKKMQLLLKSINSIDDFKERLILATKELGFWRDSFDYGDSLMFCSKKEDFGNIINIFGKNSSFAKYICEKYNKNPCRWERAVLYNEEKNLYQTWYLPERSNHWKMEHKFYDKIYLFEYLLNRELMII